MATKSRTKPKSRRSNQEQVLQKECRRLRAELAEARAERDCYKKSLYAMTRKPVSFTQGEIEAMAKNSATLDDVLQEIEKDRRN